MRQHSLPFFQGTLVAPPLGGGLGPTNLLSSDIVIIPSGITVTLNQNVTVSGSSTLTVNGTLTSGTNATALIMTGGSFTGSGTVAVDSLVLGASSGFSYTGTLAADAMTSIGANVSSATTIMVGSTLYLNSGTLTLGGSSTLGLMSNATIAVSGGTISVTSGTLNLTNSYDVQFNTSGAVNAGAILSGSGLADVTINAGSGGAVALSANTTVNGTLTINSGTLALNNYNLTISASGDISGSGTITATSGSGITINATGGLNGNLTFAAGGSTIGNLTLNLGNPSAEVNLGSDVTVTGTLTLTEGKLVLNSNNLSFSGSGNFAASGNGTISTTSGSDITFSTTGSITGAIRFTSGANTVDDLTINLGTGGASVNIGSNLNVTGTLNLQSGMINVGTNNLTLNAGATVTGGSSNSYVVTAAGGGLTMAVNAGGSGTFYVGTATRFAPAVVAAASGSASSNITVATGNGVLLNGTSGTDLSVTQPVVNVTWFVSSTASAALNLTLTFKWSSSMEVNSFNRNNAYISHYTGGSWDMSTAGTATVDGSMYTMTRAGITSLSPFAVADVNAKLTNVNHITANNAAVVYPNPATSGLYFKTAVVVDRVDIYDINGRFIKSATAGANSGEVPVAELQSGVYSARFYGKDFAAVQTFVKE